MERKENRQMVTQSVSEKRRRNEINLQVIL